MKPSSELNLRLGVSALISAALVLPPLAYWALAAPEPIHETLWRATPFLEQVCLTLAVYPIKALYMALATVAIVVLWARPSLTWRAVWWGMVMFLIGELICWVNIIAFVEEDVTLEYLHSSSMAVCLGFIFFAFMEAVDQGLVRYGDPRAKCAFTATCRGCAKHQAGLCLVQRLFQWAIPACAVLTFMPLAAQLWPTEYHTRILGVTRTLTHPWAIQWYEMRFAPLAALALFILAWGAMFFASGHANGWRWARILWATGLGHLAFGLMRLGFFGFYRENLVWFVFWEELTELLLVGGVIVAINLFRPEFFKIRLLHFG